MHTERHTDIHIYLLKQTEQNKCCHSMNVCMYVYYIQHSSAATINTNALHKISSMCWKVRIYSKMQNVQKNVRITYIVST